MRNRDKINSLPSLLNFIIDQGFKRCLTMGQLTEPRLLSKDAILVHANGRPVTYFNAPLPGLLGWLVRLVKQIWPKR